jgi:hypothetical protein
MHHPTETEVQCGTGSGAPGKRTPNDLTRPRRNRLLYLTLNEAAALFNRPAPLSDYERERLAQRENYEPLKQERLHREATTA